MATIRIYRVAEVLGLPSHEVIELLKRQHGIEVKSASNTIEEIVGRQFAERVARERRIDLPRGELFGATPKRAAAKKARASKQAKDDPAITKPKLGPPRLVKAAKAAKQAVEALADEESSTAETDQSKAAASEPQAPEPAPPVPVAEAEPATPTVRPRPRMRGLRLEDESTPRPVMDPPAQPVAAKPKIELPAASAVVTTRAPVAVAPPSPATSKSEPAAKSRAPKATPAKQTGRFVPPTLRLRVEEVKPKLSFPFATAQKPTGARTLPGQRTPITQAPLGGPRPLPSQPVRSQAPRPLPARPAVGYRPPPRPYRRPGARADRRAKTQTPVVPKAPPPITRTITLAEGMTVKDISDRLEVRAKDVLKKLIEKRLMMTINTTLDPKTATMIAREFGADVTMRTFEEEMIEIEFEETKAEDLVPRAPVVTVMGHVDHGKTTLLDAIRKTRVAAREAGGITQHIGAYAVKIKERKIVFLDTPGHEAFTTMRARGASVTDVVVLVVAADDGVMPQTQEAIDHARAANVPIIVAINKIDKADANPDRVKQQLAERDLAPEDWGGKTVMVPVSAKKEDNLDALLEMILLVTELGEHKANPKRVATGTVLETKIDRGRGPVATVLVQDGTLRVGDNFIAGTVVGRVRALIDDRGNRIKTAGPSSPIEVIGLTSLPKPGDAFQEVADAAKARQIALLRQVQAKEKALGDRGSRVTLESLQQQLSEGDSAKELPIIIKADVQGTADVIAQSLTELGDDRVKILIMHTGVGVISESDVLLASTSNAIIIGFNVRPDRNAARIAESEGIDIRKYSVIYNVTDDVKKAMVGLLEPTFREQQLGLADVREVFKVPKFGAAGGCIVTDGKVIRTGDAKARLLRDGVIVHEGKLGSLRRFKDDVNEVKSGIECGIAFERFSDIKPGDVVEVFTVEKIVTTV